MRRGTEVKGRALGASAPRGNCHPRATASHLTRAGQDPRAAPMAPELGSHTLRPTDPLAKRRAEPPPAPQLLWAQSTGPAAPRPAGPQAPAPQPPGPHPRCGGWAGPAAAPSPPNPRPAAPLPGSPRLVLCVPAPGPAGNPHYRCRSARSLARPPAPLRSAQRRRGSRLWVSLLPGRAGRARPGQAALGGRERERSAARPGEAGRNIGRFWRSTRAEAEVPAEGRKLPPPRRSRSLGPWGCAALRRSW